MVTCLNEVFIWSSKNQLVIPDHIIGCHTYHDKSDAVNSPDQPYNEEKQQFTEARDMIWTPKNKRPEKLRDSLKEVEDLLSQWKVVQCRWRSRRLLQLILCNGSLATFVLSPHSGDPEKIFVDKSLVGKLSSDIVSDAFLTDQFLITSYADRAKLDYVYFTKRPPLGEAMKRLEKLSAWEPKISQVDIPGPLGRRLERTFSANMHHDMVLVWWPTSSEEACPWTPMTTEKDRANLIVLSLHGPNISVLTFTRTECDPLYAKFSVLQPHRIFTVEQAMSSGGETTAQSCMYEVIQGKIQRVSVASIPLKSHVLCQDRNPGEDRLVLGCADGSLVLYDEHRKLTQITRAALIPSTIAWHPTGTVFFVASSRGDIQIFDLALGSLKAQLVSEEPIPQRVLQLGRFFRVPPALREIHWCPFDPQTAEWMADYNDALFLSFERGPPALLQFHLGVISRERFSCVEIVKEYIKHRQIDEAVAILSSMVWDTDGTSCYTCMSSIVNHLLRMPLNAEREGQLESTLGTFYAPKRPLSEGTILDYRDPISRLARRFFHHLLRYARFDKAYLLAVDIGARDLFMDIHYMAMDKGETALAEVAKRKAEQLETESIDSLDGIEDRLGLEDGFAPQGAQYNGSALRNDYDIDQLPASRQHPWQQEYHRHAAISQHSSGRIAPANTNQSANDRHWLPSNQNRTRSHQTSADIELEADLIHDYTAALMDPQPNWHSPGPGSGEDQDAEEAASSVQVIHFGVV